MDGCLGRLFLIVVGVALIVAEGKRAITALAPYLPAVELTVGIALGCGMALVVLWLVGRWLWEATEPARQRQRVIRQIAEARAEIRAIYRRTAQQMERATRRQRIR